jgi:hypothetical protein
MVVLLVDKLNHVEYLCFLFLFYNLNPDDIIYLKIVEVVWCLVVVVEVEEVLKYCDS